VSYSAIEAELRETIEHYVACGFDDPQRIYERVCEMFESADESEVDSLVDEAFDARDRAAATWPAVTDCDRLDRAFEALERSGIVARQNFACCQNCGRYEIVDEVAGVRSARRRVDGFVFYHMQDTDSAVRDGTLHLRYDGTTGNDTTVIGTRIVTALRTAGLAPAWSGDPQKAIEVAVRWRRRAAPPALDLTPTAASCVAMWCTALPASTLGAAADNAGEHFAIALEAAGLHAEALAWSRAPFEEGDRARALARLAVARRSPEVLAEAWRLAPWDADVLVSLLCEAGLDNPQVHAIACDKIQELRRDVHGGAAAAWLWSCAPEIEPARDRARHEWSAQRDYTSETASLALAAGLWRAGDAMREAVMAKLGSARDGWAQVAAIVAAPTADDVLAIITELDLTLAAERMRFRALARLVELGALDVARSHAKECGIAYVAYVAWRTGDTATLEAIAANVDEYVLQYDEGLLTQTELRDLRIAVAAGTAARQPARARALLAGVAETACAEALAEAREETLVRFAGGTPDPDPGSTPTLEAASADWANPVPVRRRFEKRRASRAMLAHAAAHARRGELVRSRELVALVLAPLAGKELEDGIRSAGIEDGILEAWVALGELEHVDQFARGQFGIRRTLSCRVLGDYVPALCASGDRERAVALLGGALHGYGNAVARADTRHALLELVPAVLAVAGDTAGEVQAAWHTADAVLATLRIT